MAITVGGIAATGQLLGGIGQLASGLGFGGGKDDGFANALASEYLTRKHAHDMQVQDWSVKMAMAKQYGLHPLTVLGVPMSSHSSINLTPGSGGGDFDFNAIGAGFNNLSRAYDALNPETQPPAPVEDAYLNQQRNRLLDAQVRLAEARAGSAEVDQIMAMNNLLGQPGNPPGVRSSNDLNAAHVAVAQQSGIPLSYLGGATDPVVQVEQKVAPPHPTATGYAAATDQGWKKIRDRDGSDVSVVRPEAAQSEIDKGATFQFVAKHFGIDAAYAVTAILENEHLLIGAGVAGGYLLRTPAGRLAHWIAKKFGWLKDTRPSGLMLPKSYRHSDKYQYQKGGD